MLDNEPCIQDLTSLLTVPLYHLWNELCIKIETSYDMDQSWNQGGKKWTYEYKFRRGGKTLCALYAKENCFGFMIILGKVERAKFEEKKLSFSKSILEIYNETKTYHDGKWLMFLPLDNSLFDDFMKLLAIKRKPNKK